MINRVDNQSPEGEKTSSKKQVEDTLLKLNLEKAWKLARDYSLEKPTRSVHSAADISNILKNGMIWDEMMPVIKSGKFEGVNISTDQIKNLKQAEKVEADLEKYQAKVISFHGSVDPYFYGMTEELDGEIIKHDFAVADVIDPDQLAPVNYDLIAAEVLDIFRFQQGEKLSEIHRLQREKLARKGINSEKDIIEKVIHYVAQNRPSNSKRLALFELRQPDVAENPKISEENMEYLLKVCRENFANDDQWGITIDVGHTVGVLPRETKVETVQKMKVEAGKILQTLEKYKRYIKMIHISGDVTPHSLITKKLSEREDRSGCG